MLQQIACQIIIESVLPIISSQEYIFLFYISKIEYVYFIL
jgi:hypothetical protein